MKRSRLVLVTLLMHAAAGCGKPIKGFTDPPSVHITGIVAKTAAGDHYAFADFGKTFFDHKSMKKSAKAHLKFATTQYMKIEISQDGPNHYYEYFALLGPPINTNEEASGVLRNSEPEFKVTEGWAYMSGENVRSATKWVSATAQGTKIVVQIVNKHEQIVYLLGDNEADASVTVTCKTGTPKTFLNTDEEGWFVRIKKNCAMTGPFKISDDTDANTFIVGITPIIEAAD